MSPREGGDDGRPRPTRRALLAAAGGLVAGLAGCAAEGPTGWTPTPEPTALARHGYPPDLCEHRPVETDIEAVTDPAVAADWSGVDAGDYGPLSPETVVVGVVRDGHARAYPLPVLAVHEVVNDDLGGPLLVTFCPLCSSGLVAERHVGGGPATFGVSGHLWRPPGLWSAAAEESDRTFGAAEGDADADVRRNGNLVLYDAATGSYWSQLLGRALCGPETEATLSVVPAETTTWGSWRAAHPETDVLAPPPASTASNPPYPRAGPPG